MKRVLPIALSLLLCHCGTEVGNGIIAPDEEPKRDGQTAGNGAPTSAPEAANDAGVPPETNIIISSSFLAACASPFADTIEGTFVNGMGQGFTVTPSSDGKKTLTRLDGSTIAVVTPAPGAGTYAIESLPVSPQVSCSAVTSQTQSDGSLQRSVTLSNGSFVQWTFGINQVTSLKVTLGSTVESWTRR